MPVKVAVVSWGKRKRADIQTKAAVRGIATEMARLGRFLSNPANIEIVPVADFAGKADENTLFMFDKYGENGKHYLMAIVIKKVALDTEF